MHSWVDAAGRLLGSHCGVHLQALASTVCSSARLTCVATRGMPVNFSAFCQTLDAIKSTGARKPADNERACLPCLQETPDPPQALSCVPTLQLSDIPRKVSTVPTAVTETQGVTQLTHELFTNDVLYLETAFDLRVIPADLLPLVPLFCR